MRSIIATGSIQDAGVERCNPVAGSCSGGLANYGVVIGLAGILLVMAGCRTAKSWLSIRSRSRRSPPTRFMDPSSYTAPTPRTEGLEEGVSEALSFVLMPAAVAGTAFFGLLSSYRDSAGLLLFLPAAFFLSIVIEQNRPVRPHQPLLSTARLDPATVSGLRRNLRGRAREPEPTRAVLLIIAMIGITMMVALPDLPGLAASLCLTTQPSIPDSAGAEFAMWMFSLFALLFTFGLVQDRRELRAVGSRAR